MRKAYGSVTEYGVWIIITDQELRELYKILLLKAGN
jgi:hypothetical protein